MSNNLRFKTKGNKYRLLIKVSDDGGGSSIDRAAITALLPATTAAFNVTKIEIDFANSINDVSAFQARKSLMLGREFEIISTNSTGPDGTYNVPDNHVASIMLPISVLTTLNIVEFSSEGTASANVNVIIYGTYVLE